MAGKLLSIIVPSYNMEQYLPKCLGSLIVDDAELFEQLDIIVVNDGSKDRTSEIAHEFEKKYPGVFQVIDKENGHYGSCVNSALSVAQGKFVRLLDADDYVDTAGFARYLEWIRSFDESDVPDALVSDFCYVNADDGITSVTHYGYPTDRFFTPDESLSFSRVNIGVHAVAYRLDLLRDMHYRQSEGLPYTDTEWSFLPFAVVRGIAYFPVVVKCYLEGREGQTMAADQLRANAEKYCRVAEGLFRAYGELLKSVPADSARYMEFFIRELVRWILSLYLLTPQAGLLPTEVGRRFDETLKCYAPDVHAMADSFTASRIKFHFVRAWRRSQYSDKSFMFGLYRAYRRLLFWRHRN